MKKALLLIIIFLLGNVAWAQTVPEGINYVIVDGKSITITESRRSGPTVNIPGQIQGLPVTAIGDGAFAYSGLRNITIPSTVTSIGYSAFQYSGLTSIAIPPSVTSIGGRAFRSCFNLTSITIGSSVRSIGSEAFYGCNGLTSVIISSSVTAIGEGAFHECDSLASITVDRLNPVYASVDGVLFDKSMRTIVAYPAGKNTRTYAIPPSVTSIDNYAFAWCSSLVSVSIPSSVTVIGDYAFGYCSSLTSVTIPSSTTSI
jgi:hypothetical protein